MPSALRLAGQAVVFAVVAAFVGYFAAHPVYHQVPAGDAQIKLAFQHGGARLADCRRPTAAELAKLPTAERRPNDCSRERVPLVIELSVDGRPIYEEVLPPTGLARDGASRAYQKFLVPAGRHVIEAKLRDTNRASGFDYEKLVEAELKPWQNLAVDFNAEKGGFLFR
jgi:hypothetical protein